MKDKTEYEIMTLPFQKNGKMETRELKELPYLGENFVFGQEINNETNAVGGKIILQQEIDINNIESVYIY